LVAVALCFRVEHLMSVSPREYQSREVRYVPAEALALTVRVGDTVLGWVENLSLHGVLIASRAQDFGVGETLRDLSLHWRAEKVTLPAATVNRIRRPAYARGEVRLSQIACHFDTPPDDALELLRPAIRPAAYVTGELRREIDAPPDSEPPQQRDLREFANSETPKLLDKCDKFYEYMSSLQSSGHYQSLYRVTLTTPLDHRVSIYNPASHREEDFVCFDSNSYLGLHVHPRVVEATTDALKEFGYGTPSAQLLSGTSRHMRELEHTISRYHDRQETIVFSSGYAANVGTITALIGRNDIGVADQYSHTSIHDACGWANPKQLRTFPHKDYAALDEILRRMLAAKPKAGRMIISDGVFSMHGSLADLPALRTVANKHRATLMIDEAHSTGVLGETGRGLEEHFRSPDSIDVLMGTFSKAPGTVGGYVTGTEELITYLRFFANSGLFSAAIPAALCAGLKVAFEIMASDPEPRVRLWENSNWLAPALTAAGLNVPKPESPIITVFIGDTNLLWQVSRDLYLMGVKCGNVSYPAVPPGDGILRISVNARHTRQDLERCVDAITTVADNYGILGKTKEEIREIGERLASKDLLAEIA
jgi:glycine C-acetyltransferase